MFLARIKKPKGIQLGPLDIEDNLEKHLFESCIFPITKLSIKQKIIEIELEKIIFVCLFGQLAQC